MAQNPSLQDCESGVTRQSAGFEPSVWGDYFIKNHSLPSSTFQKSEDWIRERVAELVGQVKSLLKESNDDLASLELINALQRLGLGYHFEEEIDSSLKRIHDDENIGGVDLHATALRFRLLRQQGYYVKSDVFNKFKDDEGDLRNSLANDVHGLLSLYEACSLATHEDNILEKALSFTMHHLGAIFEAGYVDLSLKTPLKMLVSHALELPMHKRIPRLEARYYIAIYEQEKERCNDVILELAKLDFHLLQLLHYQEARSLSIWWVEINKVEILNFARDRIVECYFWILSIYFEPQYSMARKIATKVTALMSINDDIYDVYGTSDELNSFTNVIERWDMEAADELPNYMRMQFQNITKTFQDFEDELSESGKSYRVHYLKEILIALAKAWLGEARWRDAGYIPTLKQHLQLTTVTTCYNLLSCASYIGMDDSATKEVFEWMLTFPKFTLHASIICRLKDDIASHESEQKRIHVASAVQCYMKEHNCTLEKACEKLLELVKNEWKSLNQEYLALSSTFPRVILMRIINLARVIETTYDVADKYTNSSLIKDHISKILVEPIFF